MRRFFPHGLALLAGCWFVPCSLAADATNAAPPGPPDTSLAPPAAAPGPPPAAPPVLPPLAYPLPEPEPDGLWANLVALHNAYTSKLDMPWLGFGPGEHGCLHAFVDAGFYLVEPAFTANPAYTFSHQQTANGVPTVLERTKDFDYDLGFAPRVSFGVATDGGFGFRTSWWHIDDGASTLKASNTDLTFSTTISSEPVEGIPGFTSPGPIAREFQILADQMRFTSHLRLDTWDWEAIQDYHLGPWTLLLSGGVRYADLSQTYGAFRVNSGTGHYGTAQVNVTADADLIAADHDFSGAGPTVAADIRRPLGPMGLALYGTSRTAVLIGSTHAQAFQASQVAGQIVPTRGRAVSLASRMLTDAESSDRDVLPVEELEVGLEWAAVFPRFAVFARTGLVGQAWFDSGNATSERGDLGFLGMALTVGVDF